MTNTAVPSSVPQPAAAVFPAQTREAFKYNLGRFKSVFQPNLKAIVSTHLLSIILFVKSNQSSTQLSVSILVTTRQLFKLREVV